MWGFCKGIGTGIPDTGVILDPLRNHGIKRYSGSLRLVHIGGYMGASCAFISHFYLNNCEKPTKPVILGWEERALISCNSSTDLTQQTSEHIGDTSAHFRDLAFNIGLNHPGFPESSVWRLS